MAQWLARLTLNQWVRGSSLRWGNIKYGHYTGHFSAPISLSLSAFPFQFVGSIFLRLWPFFYSIFLSFFGVCLPAYLSNHNPFSREHIFVGFNEFPSLVYWCTVIHHHRPQGPTLFRRVRWDFTCVQCNVFTDTRPPVLSPIRED